MPLDVNQRSIDGVTILDLDGRLAMGIEATEARRSFAEVAEAGIRNLLVNLKKVGYIDSVGLGTLIGGLSDMKEAGGIMKLLHLSERHLELFVVTKLTGQFEIFEDEQLAINSFYPDREVKPFDILEFVKSQENEKAHLGASSTDAEEPGEP